MKTIRCALVLLALLLITTLSGCANTEVDPQLVMLNNKMSLVFQLPQGAESKVLVTLKDDTDTTLKEVRADAKIHHRKAINLNLPLLEPGTYYLEALHDGMITRKELLLRWDGVEVVSIEKLRSELSPRFSGFPAW